MALENDLETCICKIGNVGYRQFIFWHYIQLSWTLHINWQTRIGSHRLYCISLDVILWSAFSTISSGQVRSGGVMSVIKRHKVNTFYVFFLLISFILEKVSKLCATETKLDAKLLHVYYGRINDLVRYSQLPWLLWLTDLLIDTSKTWLLMYEELNSKWG